MPTDSSPNGSQHIYHLTRCKHEEDTPSGRDWQFPSSLWQVTPARVSSELCVSEVSRERRGVLDPHEKVTEQSSGCRTLASMCGHDVAATSPWGKLWEHHPGITIANRANCANRVSRFAKKKAVTAINRLPLVRL